jgi:hypothetical protein
VEMTYLFDAFRLRVPEACLRPHHKSVIGRPSWVPQMICRGCEGDTESSRVDQATRREGFVDLDESGEPATWDHVQGHLQLAGMPYPRALGTASFRSEWWSTCCSTSARTVSGGASSHVVSR